MRRGDKPVHARAAIGACSDLLRGLPHLDARGRHNRRLFRSANPSVAFCVAASAAVAPCRSLPILAAHRSSEQRVVTFLRNIPSHSGALLGESAHGLADLGILLLNFVAAVRVAYAKPRLGSAATFYLPSVHAACTAGDGQKGQTQVLWLSD